MRISTENTACIVVDYQERILPSIANKEELIETSVKLLKGLKILDVPMCITGQYTKGLGLNIKEIREAAGTEDYYDKMVFSCAQVEGVQQAIQGKKNIVICGIEAHVCVMQTVLDLLEMGYQPIVIEDCISSRKLNDKKYALKRMRDAGAIITTYEALLFELLQKAGSDTFKQISNLVK